MKFIYDNQKPFINVCVLHEHNSGDVIKSQMIHFVNKKIIVQNDIWRKNSIKKKTKDIRIDDPELMLMISFYRYSYIYIHVIIYIYMYVIIYIYIYIYINVIIYIYTYVIIYIYIYM